MAGAGLIWSGIGQGIANAGSTIGSFMMRAQERDAEREYRERQAQETRDYRDKVDQEKREYRAEQDALYRRTAVDQNAGRAGAGKDPGIQQADLEPGGKYAGMAAGQLDMTENQLAELQQYRKTGDLSSKYGRQIGTTLDDTYGEQAVTEVPQALRDEFKLKSKMLSQLEESYALKGSFDDVMKGRNTAFKTGMGQAAFDKPDVAPRAGQAVTVTEGKPLINIEGGQQYNQFTGTGSTTPLGKAQINKENAQAGEAKQKGDAAETKSERQENNKRETTKDLERQVKNAKEILYEGLGVSNTEAPAELKRLQDRAAAGDVKAKARLDALAPAIEDLATTRAKLKAWDAKATPSDDAKPKPGAVPEKAPSISEVKGAPSGSSIGRRTDEGWEIKDKSGKLIGYTRGKK